MKRAKKEIKIVGRGGTCFQPVIDFFAANSKQYDGLIIFTDGYAAVPETKPTIARKMSWVCDNKENFERHKEWMLKCGRGCWIK
jgi:predicted metal-dependent peptidase